MTFTVYTYSETKTMTNNKKQTTYISSPSVNFLKREKSGLNLKFGFSGNWKIVSIVLTIVIVLSGLVGYFVYRNISSPDLAKASALNESFLDPSFGVSGQVNFVQSESHFFRNPIFLETENLSLYGVSTAVSKQNSNQKTIGVFKLFATGDLDTTFGKEGRIHFDLQNNATTIPVGAVFSGTDIIILSQIDGCMVEIDDQNCSGMDILLTKIDEKGNLVESFGVKGSTRLNLSESIELAQTAEKIDKPSHLTVYNNGKIGVISTFHYPDKAEFKEGVAMVRFQNDGKIDRTFAKDGIAEISGRKFNRLNSASKDNQLKTTNLTLLERNQVRIEFQNAENSLIEAVLNDKGEFRKYENGDDLFILPRNNDLFPNKSGNSTGYRLQGGHILVAGPCDEIEANSYRNFCAKKLDSKGRLDTSFAQNSDNLFTLNPQTEVTFSKDTISNFSEDKITGQYLFGLNIRTQNQRSASAILLLKPRGETNFNFANNGVWRLESILRNVSFIQGGKIITSDDNAIYRLKKPLFIDPVITSISARTGSTNGGLVVKITGDNFQLNPENPQLNTSIKLADISEDASIDQIKSVKSSNNGVFYSGNFSGTVTFGKTTVISEKNFRDTFLMSTNSKGEINWLALLGGQTGEDKVTKMIVDKDENVYILGETKSDMSYFSKKPITGGEGQDIFLAKYNKNGEFVWVQRYASAGEDEAVDLIIDKSNQVYFTGNYRGNLSSEGVALLTGNDKTAFLANVNLENGKPNWIQSLNSSGLTEAQFLNAKENGNIVLSGQSYGKIISGFQNLPEFGSKDIFLSEYDSAGKVQSIQVLGGIGNDEINDITFDSFGNIYISALLSIDPATQLSGSSDNYVVKISAKGEYVWSLPAFGRLKLDNENNLIVAGAYTDKAKLGTNNLETTGENDLVIAKINKDGKLLWFKNFGGAGDDSIEDFLIDRFGQIYVYGTYSSNFNFDRFILTSSGQPEGFLVKLSNAGKTTWLREIAGKGTKFPYILSKPDDYILQIGIISNSDINFDKSKLSLNNAQMMNLEIRDSDFQVFFGEKMSPNFEIVSQNEILVEVPPNEKEESVDISIRAFDGSVTTVFNAFTYSKSVSLVIPDKPPISVNSDDPDEPPTVVGPIKI